MSDEKPKIASVQVDERKGDSDVAFAAKMLTGIGAFFADPGGYDATVVLNDGRVGTGSGTSKEQAIEAARDAAINK